MNRRQFLAGIGAAGAAGLAGCSTIQQVTGSPEMEWEWEYEGFVGQGLQAMVIVTGEVENVGDAAIDEYELTARPVTSSGSEIDSRTKRVRALDPNEEQMFYFEFPMSDSEADSFDDVEVDGNRPE